MIKKLKFKNKILHNSRGFSLMEVLVGVAVFAIIALTSYQAYSSILEVVKTARLKVVASTLATEQFEIIRNLPYTNVGVISGLPSGSIQPTQTISRNGIDFTVETIVRNIDDPFDGILGGNPNDLSPADNKLVEVSVSCASCSNFKPVIATTKVSPKNLETLSDNGALFIEVFDSGGQPIEGASVHVENNDELPPVIINDVTNNSGMLKIIDAPPGVEAYEITVSGSGYSTEQTYATGEVLNPNPTKPHSTVVIQNVTGLSFAIDKTSTVDVSTVTDTCALIGNISFDVVGAKLIGTSPNVVKYSQSHTTDSSGAWSLDSLEWDSYSFNLNDSLYDLAGTIPLAPLSLLPDSSQDLKLVISTKSTNNFLVTVKDAGTDLPVSDASVSLKNAATTSLQTNKGFSSQTDWSGGGGQSIFFDEDEYFASDGNVEISDPAGDLLLKETFGTYTESGELESSSFDMGIGGSNFDKMLWEPQSQPAEVGAESVKFQVASNNDNSTWTYVGPNGTTTTFYTLSDTNINDMHDGDRYFRYKVFLSTDDTDFTPNLAETSFTFTSSCVPPGQVLFKNVADGSYTLTVTKGGYQNFIDGDVTIDSSWGSYEVLLTP